VKLSVLWMSMVCFMRTGAIYCAFVAVACGSIVLSADNAIALKAPGSRIDIDVPEHFEPSKLFTGFMNTLTGTSIIMIEVPVVAYEKMAKGFTTEALAKKGVTRVKKETLGRLDEHVFLTAEQATRRGVYVKYILLIKGKGYAALITANMPKASINSALFNPANIRKALLSAKITAQPAPSNDPFKLGYLGPFKEAGKLRASAKLYTEDGNVSNAQKGSVRNALIIAPSINMMPVGDLQELAKRAWDSLPGYRNVAAASQKHVSVGGLMGYSMEGNAKRKSSTGDVAMFIRQIVIARKGGGYFRIVAIGKAAERDTLAPEFNKIIAGFRQVEN